MYRIELAPGEVTVFRTIEELATGVRNGLITPKARVYHGASDKWLPIEFHPHYKQALELNAGHGPDAAAHKHGAPGSGQAATKSAGSKPRGDGLTFLNVPLSPVTPVPKPRAPVADLPYIEDDPPVSGRAEREEVVDHRQPVDHSPAHEMPAYETPASPSRDSHPRAHPWLTADAPARPAAAESHILTEPIRDVSRGRLGVEELFTPPAPRAPTLPPAGASPVLELPAISYPEFTPAEAPVAERSSSGSRARRTTQLVGAVILLAGGGYVSTTVFPFGRSDGGSTATSTMADRPAVPAHTSTTSPAPSTASAAATVQPAARLSPKPPSADQRTGTVGAAAAPAPQAPASSGFAPALEPRAIVAAAPKLAPRPGAAPDTTALAPTIDMQVSVPELQGADSLVALRQQTDSAMKRILRAVSGRKTLP